MSATKTTWTAGRAEHCIDTWTAKVCAEDGHCVIDCHGDARADAEKLARQVSAFHELRDVADELRSCLSAITRPGEYQDELDRARAAIAKARGEAS
jgi:hypothetical protein